MDIKIIVGLIFLVIWVVSNLIRNQQEEAKPPPVKRSPPNPNANPRAGDRSQAKDIDKFLQEIDRVRRGGAKSETPAEPEPIPVVVARVPPPPPAQESQPKDRRASGAIAGNKTSTAPTKPTPKPALKPVAQKPPMVRPVQPRSDDRRSQPDPQSPPPPPVQTVEERFAERMGSGEASMAQSSAAVMTTTSAARVTDPHAPQSTARRSGVVIEGSVASVLKVLLASRSSVPAAIVLQEILGEPRCRKARRD